jgi:cleavage and polyadenylation specificity factor subunit 2
MTSIIKLTAFSGAEDETPHCYLLQVDEFRFLLDCGWDEDFRMSFIDSIKKHIHQIDAVLLSFPDPLHLGALPYLVGKLGLSCAIYSTIPVYKMGQMFMYDLYQSRHNTEEFSLFSLDDVDLAFDKIHTLKYSQTLNLKGKGHGLQITPLPAGHMIGGTMWKIVKDGEEEIIYAVDFNHKKERHLNGCLLDSISRPHLLITDAFNADYTQARRMQRDEQLLTSILQTMRNDGNVLVVSDTAGRVLELVQLLDQMWRNQESGLMAYSLALLNNVAYNVVEFAKSQVEWMSEKIMRAFEEQRSNPFQFKYVQLCHSLVDLQAVPDPKVVLASVPDMQCGYSRELFLQWCSNPKNCIILTNRTQPGTLSRHLIDNPLMRVVTLDVRRRLRLDGAELEEYRRREKEKDSETTRIKQELSRKERETIESSDESDNDGEMDVSMAAYATKTRHDLMLKNEGKTKTGFFKQAKKSYPMFPCKEEKVKWDEYGEFVNPEDFNFSEALDNEEEKMEEDGVGVTAKDACAVPTKCVRTMETFDVHANILFIDFEGRSDGESIRKIITQIKPRQLILVRGSKSTTDSLAEFCRSNIQQVTVFVPRLNELLDATTDSHIYQVKLKDSVVSALRFCKAKEIEIAWVDALLDLTRSKTDTGTVDAVNGSGGEVKDENDDNLEIVPTLVPLPPDEIPSHSAVFVNEPRLSEFKQIVVSKGIQAEMSGGVLICNGVVAVRRNEAGRLQLEGCVSDDYYRVRELLYEQFAIV